MINLSGGPILFMHLSIDLFTWTAFALLFTNYSQIVLFSIQKVLTVEWTRWWFWSDNRCPDHLCLTGSKSEAFQNGPMDILAIHMCGDMFFLPSHPCTQIHHSWLLFKIIWKADIVLKVEQISAYAFCCLVLVLSFLYLCWLFVVQAGTQEQIAQVILQ